LRATGRPGGIATPRHGLIEVAGKLVMLATRFDRKAAIRVPFLSAMAMMGARDGERAAIRRWLMHSTQHGAQERPTRMPLSSCRLQRTDFNVR